MDDNSQKGFFEKPANVKRMLYSLYGLAAILLGLDFFIHRHVAHPWERLTGFYGFFGFLGIVALVLLSKQLRKLVIRDEGYYDD